MTAIHENAAGDVPAGAFLMPGQEVPEGYAPPQPPSRGDRRWFLGLIGGGGLAVAGAVILPRLLDGGSGGNNGHSGGGGGVARLGEGGGGAVGAAAPLFERPGPGDIPIDITNPHHILEVTQNSREVDDRIQQLFGTPDFRYINPGGNNTYPWLQLSSGQESHLTMTLRPTGAASVPGEQTPTWAQAQRPETQFLQMYHDTVVLVRDLPDNMMNIRGWTNVGTPDERMFTVETQNIGRLGALAPEARQTELLNFTHLLFQARVLG